jgi:hypothetical protein
LATMSAYWRAVAAGWEPAVPRKQWTPFHPSAPVDERSMRPDGSCAS